MKKENLAFLAAGLAFGFLFGFGLFNAMDNAPAPGNTGTPAGGMGAPAGPRAQAPANPNQGGGAPMVAEINALKRVLQENPEDTTALVRLANMHQDAAMWEQAIGYYERAVAVTPDDPNLITDMGVCFRNLQQFDRAMELFDQAQAHDPSHWQSLFNIVIVAGFDLGQFDRANAAMAAMEAMNPQPPRLDELKHALEQAQAAAAGGN